MACGACAKRRRHTANKGAPNANKRAVKKNTNTVSEKAKSLRAKVRYSGR